MKQILSYGGGICSSGMILHLLRNKPEIDLVIHADTQEERNTTYKTVPQIEKFCNQMNIPFKVVQSDLGNLYDYFFSKKKIMSVMKRDCTSKFKIRPMRRFIREKFGKYEKFEMMIGFTAEEWHRISKSDVQYISNKYPMIKDKVTKIDCIKLLKKYKITASKSACKGCIFTKKKEWIKMLLTKKKEFKRHLDLELNCNRYPEVTINQNYRLIDIKKNWENQKLLDSYVDNEPNCDVMGSCFL